MATEKAHNRRKDRIPLRDRIGKVLGIPADAVGIRSGFMAELRGKSGVTVKGCRRILFYSREAIRLDTRDGTVTVAGAGLTCTAYLSDSVGIEGRIDGVYFDDCRDTVEKSFSAPTERGSGQ